MFAEHWYQESAGLVFESGRGGQARRERKEWKKCEFEDIIGEMGEKRVCTWSREVGSMHSWPTSHPGRVEVLDCKIR
jgi:hypothetical protein